MLKRLAQQSPALLAEFLGAFMLVLASCGAIVINDLSGGGAIGHIGIASVCGLIVLSIIYAFGDISGAHVNPAVTFAFALAGRFSWRDMPGYWLAQCVGALAAAALLGVYAPDHVTLGANQPHTGLLGAFVLETILSWWLMLVIMRVASGAQEKGLVAGIVIAAVVSLEVMFAGPLSGASMNPARSLGPALASGAVGELWIYLLSPLLGMALAVLTERLLRQRKQDEAVSEQP